MAYALEALGKEVRIVNADPAPEHYLEFPGVDRIEVARSVERTDVDALIVMESGDLTRTGVERPRGALHDQHRSPPGQHALRIAQLGGRVRRGVRRDGVRPGRGAGRAADIEIATHVYLAILTDTGLVPLRQHHAEDVRHLPARGGSGRQPGAMARRVFDQNSFGKLKLIGALLAEMDLLDGGRLAAMYLNDDIMNATGTTYNDTEGLINLPLTAREIQAVVFFKLGADGDIHVSMRSKYDVDVRGDRGAARRRRPQERRGVQGRGPLSAVRDGILREMADAIAVGVQTRPG